MNLDFADIGALLLIVAPWVVLLMLILVIPDGSSLEDLVIPRTDLEWPDVVEEEDPVRWRTELLSPRDQRIAEPTRQRPATTPTRAQPNPSPDGQRRRQIEPRA